MKKQIAQDEKRIKVSTLVYGLLIILVVILGIASILAYGTRSEIGSKIAAKIAVVVPFPAAIVDWRHVVYIREVEDNMATIAKFYKSQDFAKEGLRIDFTTVDGKKRLRIKEREIMDKMVEDRIIEILAKQRGVVISSADVDSIVDQKLNEFGTAQDVKTDLLNSYGWSIDDFKKHVVSPGLYAEALAQKIVVENAKDTSKAKNRIVEAQKQLESGKDFVEVVRSHSEGSSKNENGELGWAKKDQVLPELQAALFGKDVPKSNAIIESSIGFHIVEIENKKQEGGEDVLQLRQIFVSKNTFTDWLETQKKQMRVLIPLADFTWNSEKGMVDFRDSAMREFETQERAKAQGDASITF
jgi:hypothetical protein